MNKSLVETRDESRKEGNGGIEHLHVAITSTRRVVGDLETVFAEAWIIAILTASQLLFTPAHSSNASALRAPCPLPMMHT